MGERYLIPTLYTRVSVRLTTPTQKSVSIDTSGNVVNLPDCTDLCNRFKIERVSMPSKLSVFQLRPFARSAWHYHRIVMHSNFLAGSIRFWMHPPVKMSPLLGICPQRYRQMGGITSASLLAAWDACANAWETGFRGLAIYFHYWAKKKRRTR